ncbi:hypothetical protein HK102_010444, partial [Quaeritorhiza haematococci]
ILAIVSASDPAIGWGWRIVGSSSCDISVVSWESRLYSLRFSRLRPPLAIELPPYRNPMGITI